MMFWSFVTPLSCGIHLAASDFVELSHPDFTIVDIQDMSADGSMVVGFLDNQAFAWTEDRGLVIDPWAEYEFSPFYDLVVSPDGSALATPGSVLAPDRTMIEVQVDLGEGQFASHILALSDNAGQAVVVSGLAIFDGWLWTPTDNESEWLPSEAGSWFAARDISGDGNAVAAILATRAQNWESFEAFVIRRNERWSPHGLGIPAGAHATIPTAISSDGDAVAGIAIEDEQFERNEAFVWTEGDGLRLLGTMFKDTNSSRANDVAAGGAYVVGFVSAESNWCCTYGPRVPDSSHAFIWTPYHGILDLESALETQYGLTERLKDIHLLSADKISSDGMTITGSGTNSQGKRVGWIVQLDHPFDAWRGDSNLDGEFNSSDMVQVFAAGKYETSEAASWSEGDFNGDLFFDSSDMVTAFADGGYEKGPRTDAVAVPEPGGWVLLTLSLLPLVTLRRRR